MLTGSTVKADKPAVVPYLPQDAQFVAKSWIEGGKPAFVLSFEQNLEACPNCQGNEVVYLCLAEAGPYKLPPVTRKPIRWFDGDGNFGKGWYIIKSTAAYRCPECSKPKAQSENGYIPGEVLQDLLRDHKPVIEALAAKMSKRK